MRGLLFSMMVFIYWVAGGQIRALDCMLLLIWVMTDKDFIEQDMLQGKIIHALESVHQSVLDLRKQFGLNIEAIQPPQNITLYNPYHKGDQPWDPTNTRN